MPIPSDERPIDRFVDRLPQPRVFKFVRKKAGLRANEVAEMFGVRKETVSRWERDEVPIPRTAAYALGALFEHPKLTRQRLEAFAQP